MNQSNRAEGAMISHAALAELKELHPCDAVVARWGVALRKQGKKFMGPCPLHSPNLQARDTTSFECDADGWVCAANHVAAQCDESIFLSLRSEQYSPTSQPKHHRRCRPNEKTIAYQHNETRLAN
jgi:hypothetical protein